MKWEFIFNTNHLPVGHFQYIQNCVEFVSKTGYKFFNWNGDIYSIGHNFIYLNTGIKVEDCI